MSLIGWDRAEQSGQGLRDFPGGFWKMQRFPVCWQSGGFLGSVVPRGAADSLVHGGEVLSLAEVSADTHIRHICTAQINTETIEQAEH